jgi:hypothetical protein
VLGWKYLFMCDSSGTGVFCAHIAWSNSISRSLPPQLATSQNVKNKLYIRSVYFCFILLGRNCRVKYCPAVHGLSHCGGIYPHHRNDARVGGKGGSVLSVFFLFLFVFCEQDSKRYKKPTALSAPDYIITLIGEYDASSL